MYREQKLRAYRDLTEQTEMNEQSILLFDPDYPCWDEETFRLAGEDPEEIIRLKEIGCLEDAGGGFVLTSSGECVRTEAAHECGVPISPIPPFDPASALRNNRLSQLMDRAFICQYGVKEFTVNEKFPITPYLQDSELFKRENGKVKYIWDEHPLIKSLLAAFPHRGTVCRGRTSPGEEGLRKWRKQSCAGSGELTVNLMLRNRYDFDLYRRSAEDPNDRFRFKDADRMFFIVADEGMSDDFLRRLGQIQLLLLTQRHVYIPGYADFDSHMQENQNIVIAAADTEKELEDFAAAAAPCAASLIEKAAPLFIAGTSLERLRKIKKPLLTIYDWFCDESLCIARPDL